MINLVKGCPGACEISYLSRNYFIFKIICFILFTRAYTHTLTCAHKHAHAYAHAWACLCVWAILSLKKKGIFILYFLVNAHARGLTRAHARTRAFGLYYHSRIN